MDLPGGGLQLTIPETVTLGPLNTVVVSRANVENLKITLDPSAGTFSGSFIHPVSNTTLQFGGVLYQNLTIPQGAGFFVSPVIGGIG